MLYACGWQEPDSIPSNVVIRNKKKDKHDQAAGCGAGAGKLVICCIFRAHFRFGSLLEVDPNRKQMASNVVIRNKKADRHDQAVADCGAGVGLGVCCIFRYFFEPDFRFEPTSGWSHFWYGS